MELNNQFTVPLPEREAIRATKSAETAYASKDRQYKYKNKTLINLFDITDLEQKQMSTIISKREFKRREHIRDKKKYQKNKDSIREKYYKNLKSRNKKTRVEKLKIMQKKVLTLICQGLKQEDICSQLNISKRTYINYRNQLENKNLL